MKNGGQFRGYLVAKSGRWGPLQVGFIADYVTHPEDTQAFSELLNRALWDFRKDGTDLVSCWVNAKSPFYSQVKGPRVYRIPSCSHHLSPQGCGAAGAGRAL